MEHNFQELKYTRFLKVFFFPIPNDIKRVKVKCVYCIDFEYLRPYFQVDSMKNSQGLTNTTSFRGDFKAVSPRSLPKKI